MSSPIVFFSFWSHFNINAATTTMEKMIAINNAEDLQIKFDFMLFIAFTKKEE